MCPQETDPAFMVVQVQEFPKAMPYRYSTACWSKQGLQRPNTRVRIQAPPRATGEALRSYLTSAGLVHHL